MELILTKDDISKVIKKHFTGVSDVTFSTSVDAKNRDDPDVKATLTISEEGALEVVKKKNISQPEKKLVSDTKPDTPPKPVRKPITMGGGSGENNRVISARF